MFNKPGVFARNDPSRNDLLTPRNIASTSNSVSPVVGKNASLPKSTSSTPDSNSASKSFNAASANPSTPSAPPSAPEASKEVAGTKSAPVEGYVSEARLIVGPDVELKGAEILDCDTLVVEGRVEATMDSRVIRIAENGSFSGKVSIDIAEIHGVFEGELTARSQLIIHSTGRVSGTIRFGTLVVDMGGELCGDINVLSEKATPPRRPVVEPLVAVNTLTAASG